jgi:hypothetical protein
MIRLKCNPVFPGNAGITIQENGKSQLVLLDIAFCFRARLLEINMKNSKTAVLELVV